MFFFSRVLNEFILKNPNLENKKDQRELQVGTAARSVVLIVDNNVTSPCSTDMPDYNVLDTIKLSTTRILRESKSFVCSGRDPQSGGGHRNDCRLLVGANHMAEEEPGGETFSSDRCGWNQPGS